MGQLPEGNNRMDATPAGIAHLDSDRTSAYVNPTLSVTLSVAAASQETRVWRLDPFSTSIPPEAIAGSERQVLLH
jgi:hypothetical protein